MSGRARSKREQFLWNQWGKRIRTARGTRSQTWLAEQLGVPQGTVSRWESGDRRIPDAMKFAIADVLGRTVDELFSMPVHFPPESAVAS